MLQATASFVERLNIFGAKIDSVLESGQRSTADRAAELDRLISEIGFNQNQDLKLLFELLRDRDHEIANSVIAALPDRTIHRLMPLVSFRLRTILTEAQLLAKLGIASDETADPVAVQ